MVDPSAAYIAAQEAGKRRPTELYRFWTDTLTMNYLYTDGDIPVTYGGSVYDPAPLSRTGMERDVTFDISKMTITAQDVLPAIIDHITQVEGEIIWVEVAQLLRDMSPLEKQVIFIGQLSRPAYKGNVVQLECVGFEKFLSLPVPRHRWTPQCNHTLYDDGCGLTKATFAVSAATLTSVSSNGLVINAAAMDAAPYSLTRGFIQWRVHKRLIVSHSGTAIGIRFAIPGFTSGATDVAVYPGCDKTMARCTALGNMNGALDRFFGMPYIPSDNPTTWT